MRAPIPRRSRRRSCAARSSSRARSARRRRGCTCPRASWPGLRDRLQAEVPRLRVGDPTDPSVFVGAVIDGDAFAKHRRAIDESRAAAEIVVGGEASTERRLVRDPDGRAHGRPRLPAALRRALRPDHDGVRLSGRPLGRAAAAGRPAEPVRPHRRRVRERPPGRRRGGRRPAPRRRQLLRERQADRLGGRPAAVRRLARLGDERQGHVALEPQPLGDHAHDQGDVRGRRATGATRR